MTTFNPGTIINGRYSLREYKGSGSFGEVWLAHDDILGDDVAIKIYVSLDPRGVDEFKSEYVNTLGLSHPNLLTTVFFDTWEQRPFLVMKYCANGSVANLAGKIDEELLWKFIRDVANGLWYLHNLPDPIVHQDIKPDNILMDDDDTFLITDFGISKKIRSTMRRVSQRAIGAGATAYMGPERFDENPVPVKSSDIWSLGVSIYELATGELPFSGMGGGMQKNGAATPTLPSPWSAELNILMKACLSKDTWDRPTADQVADYAEAILRGEKPEISTIGRYPDDTDTDNNEGYPEEQEHEIYYDEEGNIDFNQHQKLGKLARMILYGGILTAILGFIAFVMQVDNLGKSGLTELDAAETLLETAFYSIWSYVCYQAFKKRKPDAIFLSRCFLIYCMLSWIISFLTSFNILGIIVIIWCIIGLSWTYNSEDIKTAFPKEFRKTTWRDVVGVLCVFLIPFTIGWISAIQKNKPKPIDPPPIGVQIGKPDTTKEELTIPVVQQNDKNSPGTAKQEDKKNKHEISKKENKAKETQTQQEPKDDKATVLKTALSSGDHQTVQQLANQGYAPAYGPLAKYYLKNNEYPLAENYAKKAKAAGYPEGTQVIDALKALGYYD